MPDTACSYHPSAEAFASMLTDMPYKICNSLISNLTLYFMTNLRREPGPFFFFLLVTFTMTITMSMVFRSIAALSRQFVLAMTPAALIMIGLIVYTGFAIPVVQMRGWSRWINYINPIGYGFESLMVNEFHNREFSCSQFVPSGPGYENVAPGNKICSVVGAQPGSSTVNGDVYLSLSYAYEHSHKWRNFGILIAFIIFFLGVYLLATELISAQRSKGEILVFPRGQLPAAMVSGNPDDKEAQIAKPSTKDLGGPIEKQITGAARADQGIIQKQTSVFSWRDVVYDIKIKKEPRRILNHVDGWVKPGTLTALMVSAPCLEWSVC